MKAQITVLIDTEVLQIFEKNFVGTSENSVGKSRSTAIEKLMREKNAVLSLITERLKQSKK